MNVVLMGPYPPPHGGVQTNLVAIRRMLLERDIPCTVINLTRFRNGDVRGVYYPGNALEVLRLLMRERYDIIHMHIGGTVTLRLILLALACSLLPWSKTVLTFHSGGYPSSRRGKDARRSTLRGFVFRRLDAIIAVNEAIVRVFTAFGVRTERIHLIPPHALSALSESSQLPAVLRRFLADYQPALLTVGGLEPEYDLAIQLQVLPWLIERFPRIGLAIIGSGSMLEEMRVRVRRHPCSERILLCGDVPHEATLKAIAQCSVLLRTTWYDGDSIAVREALHYGTPVIASDNEMRPPGVHLFPVSDAHALRRRIEEVLAKPRAAGITQPSDDGNADAVLRLYASLLDAQHNRGRRSVEAAKRV